MKKYHATGIPLDTTHHSDDMIFCADDIYAAYEKVLNNGNINLKWIVEEIKDGK